jgi:ketosteroid isomerase-like protein
MRRVLFVATMILLIASSQALGQAGANKQERKSKAEQEVLKQLDDWIAALKRGDMAALNAIIADDFVIITSDGSQLNKEQDLEPIKSGDLKFEAIATEGVKVFVYGETVVVTGIAAFKIVYKGKASDIRERFFDVYQKRKGRWLVIASRSTRA